VPDPLWSAAHADHPQTDGHEERPPRATGVRARHQDIGVERSRATHTEPFSHSNDSSAHLATASLSPTPPADPVTIYMKEIGGIARPPPRGGGKTGRRTEPRRPPRRPPPPAPPAGLDALLELAETVRTGRRPLEQVMLLPGGQREAAGRRALILR